MATLIGLKRGTTNITVSYTEGGTTKTGSKSNFVVEGLPGTPPTFSNKSVSAQLVPTTATNSPAVNCGAFTAATAGHGGSITYSIVSVKNSGGTTLSGWTLTTTTSRIIHVPASTAGGTYTAVVRATEGPTDTYAESSTTATITITVNKKSQDAPTATGAQSTYATSGSISGSASGGGGIGDLKYKSDPNGGTNYGNPTTTAPSRSRSSVGDTSFVAWWTGNDYWQLSGTSNRAYLTISKATQAAPTVTSNSTVYPNTLQGRASGGGGQGTLYYKSDPNGGTNYGNPTTIKPSRSAIGTTTYVAYWGGNANYEPSPDSAQGGITIVQRQVGITAPTKTDTTYNTVAQTIFTAGSCTEGGTVYYSTLNTNFVSTKWSTTIPYTSKTDAGTYTLYWYCYVADTTNNKDNTSDSNVINSKYSISATISKATPYAPILVSGYRETYNGTSVYATAKVSASCSNPSTIATPAGNIIYSLNKGATTYSIVASTTAASLTKISRKDVGTTTIWAFFKPDDSANYNDSANVSTTVKVSKKASTNVPVLVSGLKNTYDGIYTYAKAKNGSGNPAGKIYYGETSGATTYSVTASIREIPLTSMGQKVPGSTNIWVFFAPTDSANYYNSATVSTTATVTNKYTPVLTLDATSRKYNGNSLYATVSSLTKPTDGKALSGTVYYSTTSGGNTNNVTYAANVGLTAISTTSPATKTVYAYFVPDSSCNDVYNSSAVVSKSFTVSKAVPAAPVLVSGYLETYNGTSVYATAKTETNCADPTSLATPSGTIYYSSSSGGTTYSIVASTTAASLTSMSRKDVGTTTIWAFFRPNDTTNYSDSANVSTVAKVSKKATGTISYGVGASSVWCTTAASAASTTDAAKTVKVSTASATTNTGGSITYAVTVKSGTTNISGWSVAADGKTVTTSAATPAGTYTVTVTATATSTTNYTSASTAKSSTVTVSAVALSSVALELSASSVAYNGTTGVSSLIATYNNSASKNITSSIGISTNSNPKIVSDDTTIATIS